MTVVAVTDIRHGYVDGDENVELFIEAGEAVPEDNEAITDELLEQWFEQGSIVEEHLPEATQEKIQALEDEVASLRAQLGIDREGKQSVSQAMFEANGGEGNADPDEDGDEVDDVVDPDEAEAQAKAAAEAEAERQALLQNQGGGQP